MNKQQSQADPCVFYKFDNLNNLILMVRVTVDDCTITGTTENIYWFMDRLETRFNITRDGELKKHLGVEYTWGQTDDGKMFCEAMMVKKADAIVEYYEDAVLAVVSLQLKVAWSIGGWRNTRQCQ